MTARTLIRLLILIGGSSVLAFAQPRLWTLSNVVFTDGGTASGSFAYDPSTNTYSSINITTTTGSVRTGATYHFLSNGVTPTSAQALVATIGSGDPTGTPAFALFFSGPLTNSTASLSITAGQEANCVNSGCTGPAAPSRLLQSGAVVGGALVTATVPALSSWALAGLAILLLATGMICLGRKPSIPSAS